jgi:trehalose 6-phosphate phosphatase
MELLNPNFDLDSFFKQLYGCPENALLLDYDGTLAPFNEDPGKAAPYEKVPRMLEDLMDVPGLRLVIVTGRWIKSLQPLLRLRKQPEIWGSHGLERLRPDGSYDIAAVGEEALEGLVAADEWIDSVGLRGRVERKPGSVAIHWRGVDETERRRMVEAVRPKWELMAEAWNLKVKEFDGGLELRVPGRDKGDVVNTVCHEIGSRAQVAYLGDDFTDEDAFNAVKGRGLGILVRENFRPTSADMWLKPPAELLAFLERWVPEP